MPLLINLWVTRFFHAQISFTWIVAGHQRPGKTFKWEYWFTTCFNVWFALGAINSFGGCVGVNTSPGLHYNIFMKGSHFWVGQNYKVYWDYFFIGSVSKFSKSMTGKISCDCYSGSLTAAVAEGVWALTWAPCCLCGRPTPPLRPGQLGSGHGSVSHLQKWKITGPTLCVFGRIT